MPRIRLRIALYFLLAVIGIGVAVVAVHRAQLQRTANATALLADEKIATGADAEAIPLLTRYLSIRPGDAARQAQLARLLADRALAGKASRAEISRTKEMLAAAVARDPDDDDLREKLVMFLLDAGEKELALRQLDALRQRASIRSDPAASGRIGLLYAQTALATKKLPEAESALIELITAAPGAPLPPGRSLAFELLAAIAAGPRRQPATAENILALMTAAYPDDPQAWGRLASAYLANGKIAEATDAVAKARALDADDKNAALIDARIALYSQEYDRAERILEGPLRDAPLSESLVASRAQIATVRGRTEERIAILREGIAAVPASPMLTIGLIDALADTGRTDDLRQLTSDAQKQFGGDSAVGQYAAAWLAMAEGRWLPALDLWNGLREAQVENPALARRIDVAVAACQDALGRPDLAAVVRRRLASDDPDSPMSKLVEATTLEANGRGVDALAIVESLAATMPSSTLVTMPAIWTKLMRLRIAEQLARPGDDRNWSKVDSLLAVLGSAPSVPTAGRERLRIEVLSAKGDRDGAIAAAEAAVAAAPEDASLLALLARTLIAASRETEAAARIAAAPDAIRDAPELLDIEIALAASQGSTASAARLKEIERRAATLSNAASTQVLSRLLRLFVARGDREEANRLGTAILATSPNDLEVRRLLLALAAERDDAAEVAAQADEIVNRLGEDSSEGRVAHAVKDIVTIRSRVRDEIALGIATDSLDVADQRTLEDTWKVLDGVVTERPEWPDVHSAMALVAGLRGDPEAEIGHLRRAARMEEIPLAYRRLAKALVRSGRFAEAIPVIASMRGGGGVEIDRIRADLIAAGGEREEALAIASRITPADCRDADQLGWYAAFLARLGLAAEAADACRKAIDVAPNRRDPWLTLLRLQKEAGDSAAAEATRDAAIAALQGGERDRFEDAAAGILGGIDDLATRLQAATESAPDDILTARRYAELLLRSGRRAEAMRELRRIVSLDAAQGTSTLVSSRRRLAEVMASSPDQHSLEEAIELLASNVDDEGTQLPEDTAISGRILLTRADPTSWRRGLGMMQKLDGRRPLKLSEKVLCAKVESLLSPRQRSRIREELGASITSGAGSIDLYATLVEMCIKDGDTEGGERWLAQIRALAPNAPATVQLEARLADKRGDHEAARQFVDKLLSGGETAGIPPGRRLELARVADELGFHDEADEVFAALAEQTPQAVLARALSLGKRHQSVDATALAETVRGKVPPSQLLGALVSILSYTRDEGAVDSLVRLAEEISGEHEGSPDIALLEGVIASIAGRTEEAKKIFSELIASDRIAGPQKGVVRANLAFLLAKPATAEEASTLIDEAIAELGPQPDLLDTRAVIRHARGQTTLAIQDMADVLLEPTAQHALHLAAIRADTGDLAGAKAAFEQALSLGLDDERMIPDDLLRRVRLEAALGAAGGGE